MGDLKSAWTLDCVKMFFALFLYNESVMISRLIYNVIMHIIFKVNLTLKVKVSHIKNVLWHDTHIWYKWTDRFLCIVNRLYY